MAKDSHRTNSNHSAGTPSRPAKPSVDDYTPDEFSIVVDKFRTENDFYDNPKQKAVQNIEGTSGRGPHCPECAMKPAGIGTRNVHGDWGQVQFYRCLNCDHEFRGMRRYMYEDDE